MTADNALTADPGSLAFDVAPIAAALRTIVSNRDPLMSYVAAVRAIPMGEQPITIGGNVVSRYDPLSKKPELRTALYLAIHRADDLAGNMSTLHNWATGAAEQIVGQINPRLQTVLSILDAIPSGGSVSAADVPRIREQMQLAVVNGWMVRMGMEQISRGIRDFLSHLIVDHDTFAGGPFELRRMAQEAGKQISDQAMPYVLDPLSSRIGYAMLEVGRAFIAAIERLALVLGNALAGHEAMQGAASALAAASANAWAKYQDAIGEVAAADAVTMSVTLRKLHLSTAIESWSQFAEFFKNSQL